MTSQVLDNIAKYVDKNVLIDKLLNFGKNDCKGRGAKFAPAQLKKFLKLASADMSVILDAGENVTFADLLILMTKKLNSRTAYNPASDACEREALRLVNGMKNSRNCRNIYDKMLEFMKEKAQNDEVWLSYLQIAIAACTL